MRKLVLICLLLGMTMTLSADAKDELVKLNAIQSKVMAMTRVIYIYNNAKYTVDAVEYDLTVEQKTVLINKYNTLKAELKTLVTDY